MNWVAAVTGAGLGLAYFGSLWLSTRRLVQGRGGISPVGRWARLALAAVTFCALGREGIGSLLSGLGGLWVAREYLLLRLGGAGHGS
jgi:hypothetical protein